MAERIKMSDVGKYSFGADVKFDVPMKTTFDGVNYVFTAVVEFNGATLQQALDQAVRMTKVDFSNGIRPNTNDKADTVEAKVRALEGMVQQKRVPVRVKDKGGTVVITPQAVIANADMNTLEELERLIKARREAMATADTGEAEDEQA